MSHIIYQDIKSHLIESKLLYKKNIFPLTLFSNEIYMHYTGHRFKAVSLTKFSPSASTSMG